MTNEEGVRLLYRYFLGREADLDGLKGWTALAEKKGNIIAVLEGIVQSSEFAARTDSSKFKQFPHATSSTYHERLNSALIFGSDKLSSGKIDSSKLEEIVPTALPTEKRIEIAAACNDMDDVPRVPKAGQVQVLEDGTRAQIMHNGVRVLADGYYGEWMTRLIERCRGCHEPQEERVFYEVMTRIPPVATMIELGGYWAFYSLWFLWGSEQRRAIVVEPDPKHVLVGKANARLNGLTPTFIEGFVGSLPAPVVSVRSFASGEITLPRLAVSSLMENYKIKQLDVLHCDVQGSELDVLMSCEQLFLQGRIQFLFVSTHHWIVTGDPLTHQRCLAMIRKCGGYIIAEHDIHESYACDGLIVAYFGKDKEKAAPVSVSFNRYSESLFRNPLYDLAAVRLANDSR